MVLNFQFFWRHFLNFEIKVGVLVAVVYMIRIFVGLANCTKNNKYASADCFQAKNLAEFRLSSIVRFESV